MGTFLESVNEVMVQEGIISGDDDEITSFSSTQHVASIRLAKLAIQQELAGLVSDELIPYEQTDACLTVSARTAGLASDFQRFQSTHPWLVELNGCAGAVITHITEYPGGERQLRKNDIRYRETPGKPYHWYWAGGTAKTLGFYPVPNSTYYYRYYYEKVVSVSSESDTVPFVNAAEVLLFNSACARRFKFLSTTPTLRPQLFPFGLERDPVILGARNSLMQLLRYKPPATSYGRDFV